MKLLSVLFILSINAHTASINDCKRWVELNLSTFAICAPHNEVKNDNSYKYHISSCEEKKNGITCSVTQSFPSSGCTQEIYMDKNCHFNMGAKIIHDGREDI